MINITNAAQEHFASLLASQKPYTQLRIFVVNPGTIRAECGVSYCPIESIKTSDIELKFNRFSVYVDQQLTPYLQGAEVDFVKHKFGSQLTMRAPNAKILKVGKEDSLFNRVQYFIQSQINPQLELHNGQIILTDITEDMTAIIHFGGRCNGCSMVDYTLKEGIEKKLLNHFPELSGVIDFTEHRRGIHSYY